MHYSENNKSQWISRTEAIPITIEMKNFRGREEQDDWLTPKMILAYCMIIGLISGTLSIFINSLLVLSIGAFVFASITLWYMFGDKFHRWKGRSEKKNREEPSI